MKDRKKERANNRPVILFLITLVLFIYLQINIETSISNIESHSLNDKSNPQNLSLKPHITQVSNHRYINSLHDNVSRRYN